MTNNDSSRISNITLERFDWLIRLTWPVFLGAASWAFLTLWDHGNQIQKNAARIDNMEKTRWTRDEAHTSHAKMQAIFAELKEGQAVTAQQLETLAEDIREMKDDIKKMSRDH